MTALSSDWAGLLTIVTMIYGPFSMFFTEHNVEIRPKCTNIFIAVKYAT